MSKNNFSSMAPNPFMDPVLVDDTTIAMHIRQGDHRAFEALFMTRFAELASYVYRFLHADDVAQDIAQQVFVHVWETRTTFAPREIMPFLRTLARRRAIDWLRRSKTFDALVQREGTLHGVAMGTPSPLPEDTAQSALIAQRIEHALKYLPPRMRIVALLRWQDGLGREHIAQELGVSVRTVNAQLVEAAKRLRESLADLRPE